MRGTVAKRLRAEARKNAIISEPEMTWFKRMLPRRLWKKDDRPSYIMVGTLKHTGYRRVYQDSKKYHKNKAGI
jgi:hypothetical protein